jgi:hypothetical protein
MNFLNVNIENYQYKTSQQNTEKNENTVMLLLMHRLLRGVMVFCAFDKMPQKRHWEQ